MLHFPLKYSITRSEEEEYVLSPLAETGRSVQVLTAGTECRFGAARLNSSSRDGFSRYRGKSARLRREFRWYHGY